MMKSEELLLCIADAYEDATRRLGGRSLTRVATIVASRGSFFDPLREGKTCTVRNLDAFKGYFSRPENWPDEQIPPLVASALTALGVAEFAAK